MPREPSLYSYGAMPENIVAGTMASYTVPNGTYTIWLNQGINTIFSFGGISFTGTPIASDTYIQPIAVLVGSTYVFPAARQSRTRSDVQRKCSRADGQSTTEPAGANLESLNYDGLHDCRKRHANLYQAASVSPQSLAAKNSWIGIYVQNYDLAGLGHNAWLVSHLGT